MRRVWFNMAHWPLLDMRHIKEETLITVFYLIPNPQFFSLVSHRQL